MFFALKVFLKNWWINSSLLLSALLNIFEWWRALSGGRGSDGNFFLHYNVVLGVDLIGPWWKILYLPVGGLIVILLNFWLSFRMFNRDKFLAIILSLAGVVVQIFLVIALVYIMRLNI